MTYYMSDWCREPERWINWGSYTTGELAIVDCPDCGDPALVENGQTRCDACHQYDVDSAAAMMRANAPLVISAACKPLIESLRAISYKGRGSCNDERTIFCDYCGDPALAIPGDMLAEQADGKRCDCQGCDKPGTVRMHDDEGSCWLTFEPDTDDGVPW